MLKNSLFSTLFLFQPFFFLFFFSAPYTSFSFLFPVSHAAVLLQPSFSFLFVCCPLFFSPKYFFFSPNVFQPPNTFFSSAQFFYFFILFYFILFFSVQPLFSYSFFCFILFWFSPLFFLFQRLLFFFSLAPFIQDPIFSLAASHLFYLNKSLFSSNLE